ncbi:MAG: Uma2 family endonuclease [Streptomyces sp.]|nr:Uma2 family endonuclease [Streptomyces sp.]
MNTTDETGIDLPEHMTWAELQALPGDGAKGIELWHGQVVRNRRPRKHQRFAVRMHNALEAAARRARHTETDVEVRSDVFFARDKSSFLTPDFLVRRCQPRGADTFAADTVLVGEVLSVPHIHRERDWKMDRYAEAGIPWYWEVELDLGDTWDIAAVRAYGLATVDPTGLPLKPLRPTVYVLVGAWEPTGPGIEIPEPFSIRITWADLAFRTSAGPDQMTGTHEATPERERLRELIEDAEVDHGPVDQAAVNAKRALLRGVDQVAADGAAADTARYASRTMSPEMRT